LAERAGLPLSVAVRVADSHHSVAERDLPKEKVVATRRLRG
jgi:hypothetical protein